jgi:pSer/pThr/pTyr-binding forkhead associated (FHA) protein
MGGRTAVFEVPQVRAPRVVVDVRSPGRAGERLQLQGGTVRIGRAEDNDLVLDDDRVSRHHGQLAARQGRLVYSDLGSTNGSFVNGARVTEIALGPGDVLHLGGSTLTVEAAV